MGGHDKQHCINKQVSVRGSNRRNTLDTNSENGLILNRPSCMFLKVIAQYIRIVYEQVLSKGPQYC